MVCATCRKKGKTVCPSHQIRNVVIEQLLLADIQRITAFAREYETEFVELVTKSKSKKLGRTLREICKGLEQAKTRISKLDGIMQRLYEDNIEGEISDERFLA